MNIQPIRLILPVVVASLISYLLTPLVIKYSKVLGIIDDPKKHKHAKVIHTYPVPKGGGLAIFTAILVSSLLFLPFDKHLKGILAGLFVLVTLGLIDDKYDLNPQLRLVAQFAAAGMPIAAGIGIPFIGLPVISKVIANIPSVNSLLVIDTTRSVVELSQPQFSFITFGQSHSIWILADLFALLWIVVLMNFINIGAGGLDGQLTGTSVIAALTIAFLSLRFSADITQWPVIILALILAGAFLGFLPWHKYPQKIMPGFGGDIIAGYMLGILSILSTAKVGTLMVVLAVPLIDTGYTMVRRIVHKKSPIRGDRGHLHHKLLDIGFSKSQVAYFYWGITALLGILAINLNSSAKFYTIGGVIIFVGGLLLWLTHQLREKMS